MNEKYYFNWTASGVSGDKEKYEYTYTDEEENEYNISWTKEWSAWDTTAPPLVVAFEVRILSGSNKGVVKDHYFYSDARRECSELLSNGICAVVRSVNNEDL